MSESKVLHFAFRSILWSRKLDISGTRANFSVKLWTIKEEYFQISQSQFGLCISPLNIELVSWKVDHIYKIYVLYTYSGRVKTENSKSLQMNHGGSSHVCYAAGVSQDSNVCFSTGLVFLFLARETGSFHRITSYRARMLTFAQLMTSQDGIG